MDGVHKNIVREGNAEMGPYLLNNRRGNWITVYEEIEEVIEETIVYVVEEHIIVRKDKSSKERTCGMR